MFDTCSHSRWQTLFSLIVVDFYRFFLEFFRCFSAEFSWLNSYKPIIQRHIFLWLPILTYCVISASVSAAVQKRLRPILGTNWIMAICPRKLNHSSIVVFPWELHSVKESLYSIIWYIHFTAEMNSVELNSGLFKKKKKGCGNNCMELIETEDCFFFFLVTCVTLLDEAGMKRGQYFLIIWSACQVKKSEPYFSLNPGIYLRKSGLGFL